MNRRRFFTGLIASAPALFLPKIVRASWKDTLRYGQRVNPDWVNAEYEFLTIGKWDFRILQIPTIDSINWKLDPGSHAGCFVDIENHLGEIQRLRPDRMGVIRYAIKDGIWERVRA